MSLSVKSLEKTFGLSADHVAERLAALTPREIEVIHLLAAMRNFGSRRSVTYCCDDVGLERPLCAWKKALPRLCSRAI